MHKINVVKLSPDAILPSYAHRSDAGADLYSCSDAPIAINPGAWKLIPTGIALAIPYGWVGLIHPRSGLAASLGVTALNAPGTVDSDYRGEIKVNLINLGHQPVAINPGSRIAQIVFQDYNSVVFNQVSELNETVRGSNGHGSTGGF